MDVSENGGTPQIIHFTRLFQKKTPSIVGYPKLWKHPYSYGNTSSLNSYINQPPLNGDVAKVREKQMRLLQPPAPEDDWWPPKIVVSTRGSGADTERITERCCFFESETHLVNDQASKFLGFHTS